MIMAGGKGTRFGGDTEKPMAKFMGKPLIKRVIEATKESKKITGIYITIVFNYKVLAAIVLHVAYGGSALYKIIDN